MTFGQRPLLANREGADGTALGGRCETSRAVDPYADVATMGGVALVSESASWPMRMVYGCPSRLPHRNLEPAAARARRLVRRAGSPPWGRVLSAVSSDTPGDQLVVPVVGDQFGGGPGS